MHSQIVATVSIRWRRLFRSAPQIVRRLFAEIRLATGNVQNELVTDF